MMSAGARVAVSLFGIAVISVAGDAHAQVSPDVRWRTIHTEHFQVHFPPGLEENARRAAVNAERAYAQLAAELVPPRGPLDIVIADNVDFTNGYATPFPTNRIVIYTHPPISASSLRFYDEWSALVITHELVHTFQLDRARGWWRFAQRIFGRNPALMPNAYVPAWLTEGLAVYYESKLTGSGRLEGSEHGMIARAAAIAGTAPGVADLSLETSRYPGGQSAYAYGSLLVEHLARTRGPEHVGEFVERLSRTPLPFFLNRASRRTFGVSLEDAWRELQDSLIREGRAPQAPIAGWRELTTAGRDAQHARWLDDRSVLFSANTGRDVPGAYVVDLDGRTRRIGRRNGVEPNVPLSDGSILFAQLEYVDPYRVRSDLYISTDGRQRRLTHDARLAHPDARRDGGIVAVQATPGTTRLVRVSPDGRSITPITSAVADTQWSEPRWSPDGNSIAAVRHARDGFVEIVVLDSTGALLEVLTRSRSVDGSPSWMSDGETVLFASDRDGTSQLYAVRTGRGAPGVAEPVRLSDAATGIVGPEPAPGDSLLAALHFRADGYHVGVAPLSPGAMMASSDSASARAISAPAPLPPFEIDSSPARPYRPWRTLLPRYWLPIFSTTADKENSYGLVTSGADVIGRHFYSVQAEVTGATRDIAGGVGYSYARLGNPVLGASFSQFSDYDSLRTQGGTFAGFLRERSQVLALSTTFRRPGIRSSASLTIGGELERVTSSTRPAEIFPFLIGDFSPREHAAVVLSAGWSNTRRPALSISPEDGISLGGTARRRWRRDGGEGTSLLVGVARAYKSVDLPGFAHHVIAVRAAGAFASSNSTSEFGVGGTSGSSIEVLPGYSLGDSPRTFGVRGFPAGALEGRRVASGSLEYRAPLFIPARGLRMVPVFFDKLSVTAFADAGGAWCPRVTFDPQPCITTAADARVIVSAGGEINLDAALPYDVPYRFRLGVATPIRDAGLAGIRSVSVYLTFGLSF